MTIPLEQYTDFPSNHAPPRQVDVWLPPGYHADPEQKFGVLYMHDGQNVFNPDTAYTGVDWGVIPALERLVAADSVPEVIIVGIWNTEKRVAEYLPQRPFETPQGQLVLPRLEAEIGDSPHSNGYLRFLVEELKPFIDGRYRTLGDRAHTTIMGSSMGGLISLYALCEYPDLFGGAGCLSTHWPIVDGVILDYLSQFLPAPGTHRLYFDYGTAELDALYEPYQKEVDNLMRAAGYQAGKDWITRCFAGAKHHEQAWRERVHIPLAFLLGRQAGTT
jgi:predicted alpha/beta superfamily hydrolase